MSENTENVTTNAGASRVPPPLSCSQIYFWTIAMQFVMIGYLINAVVWRFDQQNYEHIAFPLSILWVLSICVGYQVNKLFANSYISCHSMADNRGTRWRKFARSLNKWYPLGKQLKILEETQNQKDKGQLGRLDSA